MSIDNYMTPTEAAFRWKIADSTLRDRLKSRTNKGAADIVELQEKGLIKYFKKPDAKRGEWIITKKAMIVLFGNEPQGK